MYSYSVNGHDILPRASNLRTITRSNLAQQTSILAKSELDKLAAYERDGGSVVGALAAHKRDGGSMARALATQASLGLIPILSLLLQSSSSFNVLPEHNAHMHSHTHITMWLTIGKRLYNLFNCIQKNVILKYVCHVKM